jgi:quercetin dioxygenase-like cupin family protein
MKKMTAGTWIENPIVGQRVLLIKLPAETGGRYFEMEYDCQPFTGKGVLPLHYHPTYTERFDILAGKARYLLGKKEDTAGPGEQVIFPPKIQHLHPWSDSNEELRVRLVSEADPPDLAGLNAALNTGITLFGMARDGKVNKDGLPNPLQLIVSGNYTLPGACPPGLSVGAARVILAPLAMLGYLSGYRVTYPEYGEV